MLHPRGIERLGDAVLKRAARDGEKHWLLHDRWASFWMKVACREPELVRRRIRQRWDAMTRQASWGGRALKRRGKERR